MTNQSGQLNELVTTIEQAMELSRDFSSRTAAENQAFSDRVATGLAQLSSHQENLMRRHAEARAHLETMLTTLDVRFGEQLDQHREALALFEGDRRRVDGWLSERFTRLDDEAHGLVRRFDETRQHLEKQLLAELQVRIEGDYRSTVARLETELEHHRAESRQELRRLDEESHDLLRRLTKTLHHVEDTLQSRLTETLGQRLSEDLAIRHSELQAMLSEQATSMEQRLQESCAAIGHRMGEALQHEVERARDRLAAFQEEVLRQVSADLETERQHARETLAAMERTTREAEARLDATRAATDELGRELQRRLQWFDAHMARPWYERLFHVIRGRRYPAMG